MRRSITGGVIQAVHDAAHHASKSKNHHHMLIIIN